MKKKIALLMGMVLCLGVVGCGKNTTPDIDIDDLVSDWADETENKIEDEIEDKIEDKIEDEVENKTEDNTGTSVSATNSLVSSETKNILNSLQTDYNLINWGVEYNFTEDLPGIVVSVAPVYDDGSYYLLLGITNLYEVEYGISGTATPLDVYGEELTGTYISCDAIGSGNTYVEYIYCGSEVPNGAIRWSDLQIPDAVGTYTPWEADYAASGSPSDGQIEVSYELYGSNGIELGEGYIYVMLIDYEGNVIGVNYEYIDSVDAGTKYSSSSCILNSQEMLSTARGVAMFGNFVK